MKCEHGAIDWKLQQQKQQPVKASFESPEPPKSPGEKSQGEKIIRYLRKLKLKNDRVFSFYAT